MIETAADRAEFVSDDEFGTLGTYQVDGGASALLAGIFDRPSIEIQIGDAETISGKPTFFCASADIPPDATGDDGDTLQIGDTLYTVVALKPDGSGMTLIFLGK